MVVALTCFAQDEESRAEKVGYNVGKFIGYIVVIAIVVGGIAYLVRRNKK
jgi:hypothetical protein